MTEKALKIVNSLLEHNHLYDERAWTVEMHEELMQLRTDWFFKKLHTGTTCQAGPPISPELFREITETWNQSVPAWIEKIRNSRPWDPYSGPRAKPGRHKNDTFTELDGLALEDYYRVNPNHIAWRRNDHMDNFIGFQHINGQPCEVWPGVY